jgi:nucleoid-associated protein YgaU
MMYVDENEHRPPELGIAWSSLQFKGFLASCTQTFTKFSEDGTPTRATLQCTFIESRDSNELFAKNPLQSPDTTKYRAVRQGDSLWAMAANEYGEAAQWRQIASANGIDNPRRLRTGDLLVVPALLD